MGLMTDAAMVNIEGNTKQLVDQINKADKAMQNFDKTLTDILSHLTAVENGLKNINGVTNNFNKTQKGNFFNAQTDTFIGSRGKVASFTSTRSKAYKQAADDYHKIQLQEIEVMKKQIEKDQKLIEYKDKQIEQYANEVATRRINANAKYKKSEYLNSKEHLAYEEGLGIKHKNLEGWYAAKSAHPERFLAGALNYSFSHQGARALDSIGNSVRGLGVGGRLAGDVLNTAASFLKAPAAGLMAVFKNLGQEMVDLGKAATQAYAEIESIKTQLGVVFSNQTQADAVFGQISQYAIKSPFGVQQTSELAVLLKQSGVYASDLMDTLRMLGDTAGGNMEKMKRIANNYAQIVSIGKASMLDMRQFAYAGIPIFEAVSKELGVSQQELRKLISDGKVTSDIIEKVFKDLTGINGLFENATEKGAKTLKARLQNLADARQLAFGQIGEWGVKLGTQTGGDSFVSKLVDIAEKVYEHLKTDVSTVNIEKSVQTIATRDNNIERYKSLIEFAQTIGSKSLEAAFIDKLNKELAKLNPDENRSVYVQSYQNKTRGFALLNENGVTGTVSSIQQEIDELNQKINNLNIGYWKNEEINRLGIDKLFAAARVADAKQGNLLGMAERGSDARLQVDALQERVQLLEEILDALKDYNNISDELRRAIKEDAVIQAQQLAFDTTNKNADASTSLNASFNELASIFENSETYKQKEEEKKMKILTEAQAELRKIAEKADENGNVRFNEFDREEFQRLNNAGAFNATKLDIVEGNRSLTSANRHLLESQFANASGKVIEELSNSRVMASALGRSAKTAIETSFMSLAGITDDKEFFKKFGSVLNDMTTSLQQLEDFNPSDRNWLKDLQAYLIQSTNTYEARIKGVNADITAQTKGKELPDFIPLWKRIIASDTGWSAERITNSKEFMSEYLKYSSQQIARGGIQGLANAGMRAGEIGSMLSYTSNVNKQGVRQVDWEKTEQNIYKYALALETPLKRSSAAMNGLADAMKNQVETYRKLTADIYTVGEDWTTINNDIKGQYSVAQGLGNANILDNAFEAFAKESDNFKVQFDEKQGLVVFDKLSNTIVGSVADLKANSDIKDENLKKYLENVKVDNLVTALDEATRQIEINSQITQVEAEMLNEATKLEAKRLESRVNTYGQSGMVLGALKGSRNEDIAAGALSITARNDKSVGYQIGKDVNDAITNILKKIADLNDFYDRNEDKYQLSNDTELNEMLNRKGGALRNIQETLNDPNVETFESAIQLLITEFPNVILRILDEAQSTENAIEGDTYTAAADKALRESPFSLADAFRNNRDVTGNSLFGQNIVESLGYPLKKFETLLEDMTKIVMANPSDYSTLTDRYTGNMLAAVKREGEKGNLSPEQVEEYSNEIKKLANNGDWETLKETVSKIGDGDIWDNATKGANKFALSLGKIGLTLNDISDKTKDLVDQFASEALSSSMTTWGDALAKGKDESAAITKNMQQLASGLLENLGSMITQAGLSLAISSVGDKAGVLAGLAIAAAGGGLSFMGGYLGGLGEDDNNKEDKEYEKLLKIKQDLSDLLKQAREDAIYYENTVRHKKAISANDEFTTRSVHDAIITPRGDVVTTDPKDYLIATKTPKSLIGSGAPTINFSVVDKSTGIKVTQQKSSYNESTNTIEFEAIIESKVQEVIASSKGDEAFAARQARLSGRTVIA